MTKDYFKVTMSLISLLLFSAACGSSTTTATGTSVQVSTIDQLPRATSPVVTASGNLAKNVDANKAATTGLTLSSIGSTAFNANSSMAMCRAANAVKQAVNDAAFGDLILCYVQNMATSGVLGGLTEAQFYNGEFHAFTMNFSSDEGPDHVRIKAVRDASGLVTQFIMQACEDGTQNEHLMQTISGTTMTMHSEGSHTGTGFSGNFQTDVTGTLNTSGLYTAKTVTSASSSTFSQGTTSNVYRGEQTFVQSANSFTLSGYDAGTYQFQGSSGTFGNQVYAAGQLIDGNSSTAASSYDIRLIAVGDGAANSVFSNTFGNESFNFSQVESWNGDTTAVVTSNDFTSSASAGTPPSIGTPSLGFSGDEVYACNATSEATLTVDETAVNAACSRLSLGHQWIDCWNIIENTN